jgi:hypothetical protein
MRLTAGFQVNDDTYEFIANTNHDNSSITCRVKIAGFPAEKTRDETSISVEYPPKFKFGTDGGTLNRDFKHGATVRLSCDSAENPKGKVRWSYGPEKNSMEVLDSNPRILTFPAMNSSIRGWYECSVDNSIWKATKYFKVEHVAQGKQTKSKFFRISPC